MINYFVKQYKIKQREKSKRIKQQKQNEAYQRQEIQAQKKELEDIKVKEEKRKELEQEKARINKEKQLIKQMFLKGSFPILKYNDSNSSTKFEINKPITTVGRDKGSNIICIANKNMSRNHFSIVFENNVYQVIDNNSTNGIKVNGVKVKQVILENSDIIEIADISFTFYK